MGKKGRKRNHHLTSGGETILGLGRLSNGRWVDIDDRKHPWTCHDERQAVAEFYRRRAGRDGETVSLKTKEASFEEYDDADSTFFVPNLEVTIAKDGGVELAALINSNEYWRSVEEFIRNEPHIVARRTGIKQIEWLDDLKKPPPPITLQEVGELFYGKRNRNGVFISKDKKEQGKAFADIYEAQRSWHHWLEFCEAVAPAMLIKEVTEDGITAYSEWLKATSFAPKTIGNRLRKVGTIMNHAIVRRKAHRAILSELKVDFNKICKCPDEDDDNADPIYVDDFEILYRSANVKWRAILLCMLNFAMHPGEAGDMVKPPKELDLHRRTLKSRRTKSKVLRVAMVWQETIDAIKAYQFGETGNASYRQTACLFLTKYNQQYARGGLKLAKRSSRWLSPMMRLKTLFFGTMYS